MSMWIGPYGGLLPVQCPRLLPVQRPDRSTYQATLAGRVFEQRDVARPRRQWQASLPDATRPAAYVGLRALLDGALGGGPWVWVEPWAASVNMLTPEAAWFGDGTWATAGSSLVTGPQTASDGTWLPASVSLDDVAIWAGLPAPEERIAVVPGQPLTATVYASTPGSISIVLRIVDASGATLTEATGVESPTGLERVTRTIAEVPAGAAGAMLVITSDSTGLVAGPQVTMTAAPVPYAAGEGARFVSLDGWSLTPLVAHEGFQVGPASVTVQEVG